MIINTLHNDSLFFDTINQTNSKTSASKIETVMRYLLIISMFIFGPVYGHTTQNTTDFVITVKTDNYSGLSTSNKTSFNIPTKTGSIYNYSVDWNNDGSNISTGVTGDITHDFGIAGVYTIRISGVFPQIYFGNSNSSPDILKLLSIEQWGTNSWRSFNNAFSSCRNLIINAIDKPDLSNVSDLSHMFQGCANLNNDIGNWNTSAVTNMSSMLSFCEKFNQDVSRWNTTSVTNMSGMFIGSVNFNQDISKWNTSSVNTMSQMFTGCKNFNQDISNWNTTAVTNMSEMLSSCIYFNQDISNWNTGAVLDMSKMFYGCINFNQNISKWNTASVTNMSTMFNNCTVFNQNIGNWNTGAVKDMSWMFSNCINFKQDISNWNTGSVTNMENMFFECAIFNQNISMWNTGSVTNMLNMFSNCIVFNNDISKWNTGSVTNMSNMFGNCTAFNNDISKWNTSSVTNMASMFYLCKSFNQDIGNWNTKKVTNMSSMFQFCKNFNQDIGRWNTSAVKDMSIMFNECPKFNQDIGNWNTSSVIRMSGMFINTSFNLDIGRWNTSAVTDMSAMFYFSQFNQNISNWNTSSVTNMSSMFQQSSFNQNIGNWNTAAVTDVNHMFYGSGFNQTLGKWNIGKVLDMTNMLDVSGISFSNYDTTLIGWQASAHQPNITLGAVSITYCAASDKRNLLINTSNWNFVGDSYLNSITFPNLFPNGYETTTGIISCIDPSTGFFQIVNNAPSPRLKFITINPKVNSGYNLSATVANNSPLINNQMRSDGAANTTALSNRMTTIVDAGTNNYPSGMTVRIYYSPDDSTAAMAMLDTKVSSPISSQWFKFSGSAHTANVNNILAHQTVNNITGAIFLVPSAYGTEKNISYVEFSNITNFSTFGFLAARTANVLPVTLTSFTATTNKCTVNLVWKVAHEENSSYYAVETSNNGKDFNQVAKIISNNKAEGGTYRYNYLSDNGTYYFRLRSVDFDGKFAYSTINVATTNCTDEGRVSVSPNPSSEKILVQGISNGSFITLHDLMGKILIKTKVNGTSESLHIGKYAKGIYLLNVTAANGELSTVKVVRQ